MILVLAVSVLLLGCGCREPAKQVAPPEAPQPPDPPAK
jgi:hypothetical protein